MRQNDRMFDRMSRELRPRLIGYCSKMLGDASLAEDVAQETLLRAWQRRDAFDPLRDPAPWLFTVARNLCIEALRSRARTTAVAQVPERPSLDDGPVERLETLEEHGCVRRALAAMPQRQRDLLVMREIDDVAYPTLAEEFGVSEPAARVMLFRARRMLRDRFVAAAGAFVAVVASMRTALHRARRSTQWMHASSAGEAVLANVAAITIAIASGLAATESGIPDLAPQAALVVSQRSGATAFIPAAREAPAGTKIRTPAAQAPTVRIDPTMESHVEVPVAGSHDGRGRAWLRTWRESDTERSVVLTAVDDVCSRVCNATSGRR
ncbi:MAG TPA: sigma-70 family RNA polymerase sigma factor [Actinomycetota bacterium]|nr:sigma-70 family RNA polymerase sigma factor [Actinomycetota bacterium]